MIKVARKGAVTATYTPANTIDLFIRFNNNKIICDLVLFYLQE